MRDPLAADDVTPLAIIFDVIIALLVGVIALANVGVGYPIHLIDALICAALALRRAAPSAMMVLAVLSAGIQVGFQVVSPLSFTYALLFFTAGNHHDWRVRRGSLAVAAVGSVIAGFTITNAYSDGAADTSPNHPLLSGLFAAAGVAIVVVGGWVAGFITFQRRSVAAAEMSETIAELERRRMLDLYDEQAERSRLARDMHDVVAHSLAVVVAQAEGARYAMETDPEAARDALGVIATTARGALGDVRSVLEELRSTESDAEINRTDRDQLFARMRAAGMLILTSETGEVGDVGPAVARTAYRVLTEALTNALKYGDLARPVIVDQDWTDGCRLTVRNTIALAPLAPGGAGHGLLGMAERAAQAGGVLTSAADGDDWLVTLTIPTEGPPR